ncbi:MAG: methyl-accepting chemotaxis protein [Eubacterium sp.]|jgi:methyl-accepting chemotaxis protein|nr:methyl-accepting chemotaxis protein [Eubacterium sp.]
MKNWKVKSKIMGGFVGVFLLLTILSVTVIIFFVTSSETLSSYATAGQEKLLRASTDLMNMRRMTGMIHAFAGDEERIDGYHNEFNASYEAVVNYLDTYLSISGSNPQLLPEDIAAISSSVSQMEKELSQYKTLLFEPNVVNAKKGDIEALNASNVKYGSLIVSVSEGITALIEQEGKMQSDGIANTMSLIHFMVWVFVGVTAVVLVISLLLGLYISGMISKPLSLLSAFMNRAGGQGDITLSQTDFEVIGKYGTIQDEVGQCTASTASFIQHVLGISEVLSSIAEGDLTHDFKLLSDKDVMGISLIKMSANLNNMFGNINASSSQVSIGANQVSDGAQALSQGSTEQAASIEELSSSIAEISDRTRRNAEMAEKAAELADTIKSNAEKGSAQMGEMMSAAKEIHTASQSIGKVMKTIDDIAFQTNILALNAAVEAARAGQHGKGFAVVAEEVRNLATKSASAAKETDSLIANTIEKAELGVRIAGSTSESFAEIVSGVNESSRFVSEIARESEAQSIGISQINTGINQVAQVVQQNSATAEQSAAASEEMSSQSAMLQELISQFKIKDGRNRGNL